MKVLFIAPKPSERGGIANWMRIVLQFYKDSNDVQVCQYCTRSYKNVKHSFYERYILNGLDLPSFKRKLRKMLKKEKPDLIHIISTGEWSVIRDIQALKISNKKGIPSVVHFRFGLLPRYKKENNIKWRLIKKEIELSSSIWTLDSKTYEAVLDTFPLKKVFKIPNPVDLSEMPLIYDKKSQTITFVGWVVKTKGVEELLDAWQEIKNRYPTYYLNIIGAYDEKYFENLAQRFDLNSVKFLGKLSHEDTLKIVASSELFVLPSYTEGFPNAIVEAMALKTPVISTDVGAIRDMLDNDCGLVVMPKDSVALAHAICTLLEDKDRQTIIKENAFQKVYSKYSKEVIFSEYVDKWMMTINRKQEVVL